MSLTFYMAPMSTASLTEAVLAELDVPVEIVKVDIQAGGTRTPEFLAINPNGRVPTIVHDGTVLWESAAITLYLGEFFGVDAGLFPAPGPLRGEAMKWVVWSNVVLGEAAGRLSQSMSGDGAAEPGSRDYVPESQRSPEAAAKAHADLANAFAILESALENKPFLLGDYSLVDTHVHCFPLWMQMMELDMTTFPKVTAWTDACSKRPALVALTANSE